MDRREVADSVSARNDVSWYSRNPALLAAAASFPYPYRPGMVLPVFNNKGETTTTAVNPGVPGVMVAEWVPSVGRSQSATDPASVIGKEIFARVRAKFSGSIDADAPDFVIYAMALDSIFAYIGGMKRLYRVLNAYSPENYILPDGLLMSMGYKQEQINEMRRDRIKLFQNINELIGMTRKFMCPAILDIFNRHYWLNDNVYTDANSINAQFYVFNQLAYYKYGLKEISTGVSVGSVDYATPTIPSTGVVDYLFEFGRSLINALADSDDAYIISGYLMRAYEGTPTFSVDELEVNAVLAPVYEPEVLAQIENSLAIPGVGSRYFGGTFALPVIAPVYQDPASNAVISNPTAKLVFSTAVPYYLQNNWNFKPFISLRSDMPTVADTTIATRMKMAWGDVTISGTKNDTVSFDIYCASEILVDWSVSSVTTDGANKAPRVYTQPISPITQVADVAATPIFPSFPSSALGTQFLVTNFDWHPIGIVMVAHTNTTNKQVDVILGGDIHNTTVVTVEQLANLHRVCLYSEFDAFGQLNG